MMDGYIVSFDAELAIIKWNRYMYEKAIYIISIPSVQILNYIDDIVFIIV